MKRIFTTICFIYATAVLYFYLFKIIDIFDGRWLMLAGTCCAVGIVLFYHVISCILKRILQSLEN